MTKLEAINLIETLHTGLPVPSNITKIMKLVLGKMSRVRLNDSKRIAEITVGGNTEFLLSTYIPDFLDFKVDASNKNRGPYFLQETYPSFIKVTAGSRFIQGVDGGYCYIEDGTLVVSWPVGYDTPDTLYVPIFSKYMVLDSEGNGLKEEPENDEDTFIFNSVFDDVFIDGVMLYLERKEMDTTEYTKALSAWNTSLNSLVFNQ